MKRIFFPNDHKPGHIKSLDGIRGVAVLIVIIAHAANFNLNLHPMLNLISFGKIGVYAFFILSAYLLDKQIIEILEKGRSNYLYWLNYLLRRILRIYPLFLFSLLVYYLLNRKYLATLIKSPKDILNHLNLDEGYSFYWSIPAEFRYYLVSPVILIVCYKILKWNIIKCLILIFAIAAGAILVDLTIGLELSSTIRFLPTFLLGTSIALIEKFKRNYLNLNFQILAFIALIAISLSVPFYIDYFLEWKWSVNKPWQIFPYSVLIAFIFLAVRFNNGIFKKISELKVLRFFGTISFSLYLFHWGVALFVNKFGSDIIWLDALAYYLLSILFSCTTYILIEYPLSHININNIKELIFSDNNIISKFKRVR